MRYNFCGLILLALLSITACKKDQSVSTNNASSPNANITVRLTDSPGNYEQVNIDVQSVEIHSDNGGWITLSTLPGIYNLLNLTNGVDTLIANGVIPAGHISQIRLHLGTGNAIKVNGIVYPLTVPSGYTSGLKINVDEVLVGGNQYALVLDFDAGHSIVEEGNGQYKLKPVIHGQLISGVLYWGTLSGVILPPASYAFVSAVSANDTASTYINILNGQYMLSYLTPGAYTVSVTANPPYHDTTFTRNVSVGANVVDTISVQ